MPHVTLEYSANLDGRVDMAALCRAVLESALSTGIFETGAVRVRAVRCEDYAIADLDPANGFIHAHMRIGAGRDAATKQRIGEILFQGLCDFLAPELAGEHFALSFEIAEIDADLNFKKNAMHQRLRSAADAGS